MLRKISFCLLLVVFTLPAISQISLSLFSNGYDRPVDIKNCGDDRLFIVEKEGSIYICDSSGNKNPVPFLNISNRVETTSEQGLLGLAFAPDYLTSGYFYLNYNPQSPSETRISRFRVDPSNPNLADSTFEEILLRIYQPYSNHKGGHIAFGSDGYLYIGMGDGGAANDPENRSQNPDSLLGKMLRIQVHPSDSDYAIPPDNPFAHDTTLGRPEIWSLGLRNPWRFSFDSYTHDLWIGDVGQNQYEEIDFQPNGKGSGWNYGWRCYEASDPFNTSGCQPINNYIFPVHEYSHGSGCSVTGGYVYRGARFQELYGKYFFTDFCTSTIRFLMPDNSGGFTHTNLGNLGVNDASTFGVDWKGELYVAGINTGNIYKFSSANCMPVATINGGKDTLDDCNTGYVVMDVPLDSSHTYLWTLNGDTISSTNTHTALQEGTYIAYVTNQTCTSTDSIVVDFTPPFVITFSNLDTLYCENDAPANILPNIPGGVFTGNGITGATFTPANAGIGSHLIVYTYTNERGCSYSHAQSVRVDGCVNVPEFSWMSSLVIFPNPTTGDFYIEGNASKESKLRMDIYDITGRNIYSDNVIFNHGKNIIPVASEFSKGIYIVRFSDESSTVTLRLIHQ